MDHTDQLAVLFADVSGSRRLYLSLGDAKALALIDRCLKIAAGITRQAQGRVIKNIGDEIMAVFPRADLACAAAIDMQIAVCSIPECMENAVTLHCGLHFGQVAVTNDDVFGDTVNVAARLAEYAKSGQIIASVDVVRQLPEALAQKTRFVDLDRLRGQVTRSELYEVLWESDEELTSLTTLHVPSVFLPTVLTLNYREREYSVRDDRPSLTLGRDANADIVIYDKKASRRHGRIEKLRDKFVYTDFSSNGTFVALTGEDTVMVRRDSIALRDSGTIGFDSPDRNNHEAVIRFEVGTETA